MGVQEIVFTAVIKWNRCNLKEILEGFKNPQQQEIE